MGAAVNALRHPRSLLPLLLFTGPVAWLLSSLASALLVRAAEGSSPAHFPMAPPLAGAAVCLAAALLAGAARRRLPQRGEPVDELPPQPWLAIGAVALSLFFALVCLGAAASAWFGAEPGAM